jgi:predicted RNase H-like nuclease
MIAGVVPCPGGWLVASGRLQGITLFPTEPEVFRTFVEVLDYKPALQVIALGSPVGLLEKPRPGGRTCEQEARRLLGRPRCGAISSAPSRLALAEIEGLEGLSAVTARRLPRIAEAARELAPYWQRTVFEVHPELSFFQLNEDRPMRRSKHTIAGREERRELLMARLPGIEQVLDAKPTGAKPAHLFDAAAALWTSRRIMARAVTRLPADPEWDDQGLRMELVR